MAAAAAATACNTAFGHVQDRLWSQLSPRTSPHAPIANDLSRARRFWEAHGFRTSLVHSPRPALSIYKDSCLADPSDDSDYAFLQILLGLHPHQDALESFYESTLRPRYCLWLYCRRLREACPRALASSPSLGACVRQCEEDCRGPLRNDTIDSPPGRACDEPRVAALMHAVRAADPRLRTQQLQHEYERLAWRNATLANAYLQLWQQDQQSCLQAVYFKQSHATKYERFTLYFYDPAIDELKPPPLVWLPSLSLALSQGPRAVARAMVDSFWAHLLRRGYHATPSVRTVVSGPLERYFLSGLAADPSLPLLLAAHFTPTYPLSLYFHGPAGAGKSSLARHWAPALQATLAAAVDPELVVQSVKQNLNKSYEVLQLELDLRPNNNDLSVMSIIQGRRRTMGQSKAGLVVVDLEEMASHRLGADPHQRAICQLLSQRFSGRKGDYKEGVTAPTGSAKRGISGDATILTLFTSNYELEEDSLEALTKLAMFSNLQIVEMEAVAGRDREDFAHAYLCQLVQDGWPNGDPSIRIDLSMPLGEGDTRPLVRLLRMVAFYVCASLTEQKVESETAIAVTQTENVCTIQVGAEKMEVRVAETKNLVPLTNQVFDPRVATAMEGLGKRPGAWSKELSIVLDFWLARTLAPAVIVSSDQEKISRLVSVIGKLEGIQSIPGIDASQYKMMKSLYDRNDTPNLRDDILKYGRGALVAVELVCETMDAQLCIRELIEDTPSMTAFSTDKSALYKSGILFCVCVCGDLTPEIRSRASLII